MYHLGWPFSLFISKILKVELFIKINVKHDAQEDVYIATSPDISGLIIETDTFEQLQNETKELILEFFKHKSLSCKKIKYTYTKDICIV